MHEPGDGQNHLYFYFLLELLVMNVIPHNLAKAYFWKKMENWRFRRVKTFDTALFLCHSVFVMVTWLLGLAVYHAGNITVAVPDKSFIFLVTVVTLYCYLVYWSMVGLIVSIVVIIWAICWVWRYPSRRRQRNQERERQRLIDVARGTDVQEALRENNGMMAPME